jgi:hypothetical protein
MIRLSVWPGHQSHAVDAAFIAVKIKYLLIRAVQMFRLMNNSSAACHKTTSSPSKSETRIGSSCNSLRPCESAGLRWP